MVNATLNKTFPVVFILSRPLVEACMKGLRVCAIDPSELSDADADPDLPKLAAEIDDVIVW